jgi:hypothetical protein
MKLSESLLKVCDDLDRRKKTILGRVEGLLRPLSTNSNFHTAVSELCWDLMDWSKPLNIGSKIEALRKASTQIERYRLRGSQALGILEAHDAFFQKIQRLRERQVEWEEECRRLERELIVDPARAQPVLLRKGGESREDYYRRVYEMLDGEYQGMVRRAQESEFALQLEQVKSAFEKEIRSRYETQARMEVERLEALERRNEEVLNEERVRIAKLENDVAKLRKVAHEKAKVVPEKVPLARELEIIDPSTYEEWPAPAEEEALVHLETERIGRLREEGRRRAQENKERRQRIRVHEEIEALLAKHVAQLGGAEIT